MFRTSYAHHQADYIVHAALYVMLFVHLCKQTSRLEDVVDTDESSDVAHVIVLWFITQCRIKLLL